MISKIINFVNSFGRLGRQKIVEYQAEIILIIGVILVCLLSFSAGYLTAKYQQKEPIKFEQTQNAD